MFFKVDGRVRAVMGLVATSFRPLIEPRLVYDD